MIARKARLGTLIFLASALLIPAASAQAASPWWHLSTITRPTNLVPGEEAEVVITAANLGTAPVDGEAEAVAIEDRLPAGLEEKSIKAEAGFNGRAGQGGKMSCEFSGPETVLCSFTGSLAPYSLIEVRVRVKVKSGPTGAKSGELNEARVSGGGAPEASIARPITVSSQPAGFGFSEYDLSLEEEGGGPSKAAGSHDFQLTTTLALNQGKPDFAHNEAPPEALPKDIDVKLPPGLIGNPNSFPTCPLSQFFADPSGNDNHCPESTVLGVALVTIGEPSLGGIVTTPATPIVNLEPAFGEPARFGFVLPVTPVIISAALRDGEGRAGETASEEAEPDYGITAASLNTSETAKFLSAEITFWGTPGDVAHDISRGTGCLRQSEGEESNVPCTALTEEHPPAFQTLPTSCSGEPLATALHTNAWIEPLAFKEIFPADPMSTLVGCNNLPFSPHLHAEPTSDAATSGSGFNTDLTVNDEGLLAEHGKAQSQIKKAVVTLPEGFTSNPSVAEGLKACSLSEYGATRVQAGSGCTDESKIGSIELESPLVKQKVTGSLYVAEELNNPFHNLLTLYMVIRNAELGLFVKQPLKVEPNPKTGQLTTTVDDIPQLPFSHFRLAFRPGQRAPLITPPACGTYTVQARLYPWSEPSQDLEENSSFQITQGPEGEGCPSKGLPPFHPNLVAGALNNAAGNYSPFYLHMTRRDSEQEITHFSIKLPPGVIGKLAGISECTDAQIAAAKARERLGGGQEELESPSCPANSQIGRTLVGTGVGSVLAYAPGKVYLAGSYHGSAISVVAITAAKVGPFDLGTVVVREALSVNPETAEVFVDSTGSDPIPHIVDGTPTHLRDIRVYMDRPQFVLNPTNCERTSTASTLLGAGLDFESEADDNPFTATSPFQVAACSALPFAPKLSLALKGKTNRGAHPAFHAHLAMNGVGEAGIAVSQVTLPRSEYIENAHFRTICTRVQFKAGSGNGSQCPPGSIYGHAKAVTPLLSEPLEGPVFLRSSEHQLPDLVVALHNSQVDFDLVGRVDSVKGGGLRNTFESAPDAPVSSFDLWMDGGKKGLFVNSTNLCARPYRAQVSFTGQNGKVRDFKTKMRAKCPKHKKHKRAHRRHARAAR